MDLNTVWFVLIAILFAGFFFLEGFDYGVGIVLPFLGHEDKERRVIINSIGPVWDANEVWMITAGGALFASFPHVYATLLSGFYLPLILLLVALIARGVGFEFRSKHEGKSWRGFWDWMIFLGSLLPALLWGIVVGNLMQGIAIDESMYYRGGLLPLLNPFALFCGIVFVSLFITHGVNFLSLKVSGAVEQRAKRLAFSTWAVTTFLTIGFLIWAFFGTDFLAGPRILGLLPAVLAIVALLVGGVLMRVKKYGWGFVLMALTIIFVTMMVFTGLYPRILISTLDSEFSLTIYNAASSPYTLRILSIIALIFMPIVLAYQTWTYWVFRKRVKPSSETLKY